MSTPAGSRKLLIGFILVGAMGFVVDAAVLTVLSQVFGLNLYVSRLFSFVVACLATWLLNRAFVFASTSDRKREYGRYFVVQSGGALLNLGVFSVLVALLPPLQKLPVVPLAIASAVALFFNFAGSRLWVFRVAGAKR